MLPCIRLSSFRRGRFVTASIARAAQAALFKFGGDFGFFSPRNYTTGVKFSMVDANFHFYRCRNGGVAPKTSKFSDFISVNKKEVYTQ